MKTLIVKYLPSGETSNSKKLLNFFFSEIKHLDYSVLDLIANPPPLFDERGMAAYAKRNFMGQSLSPDEQLLLREQDQLISQFKSADIIVMCYPMHNFGMPGIVKSYFDAIMFNRVTFKVGASGPEKVMKGHKALTLFTAGSIYPEDKAEINYPYWDTLTQAVKIKFNFMGFDACEVIGASFKDHTKAYEQLSEAQSKIKKITSTWYSC